MQCRHFPVHFVSFTETLPYKQMEWVLNQRCPNLWRCAPSLQHVRVWFWSALMGGTLGSLLGNWHKGQNTLVTQSSVNRAKQWLTGLWECCFLVQSALWVRMLPLPVPAVRAHASSYSPGWECACFLFQSFQKDLKYSATLFKCLFFGLKYKSAISCHRPSNGRADIGRVHIKHARSSGFDPQHKRAKWRLCSRSFSKNFRVLERNIHLLLFYLC